MSITSLGIATSGMTAARMGLSATGHNMANSSINGYSRQRIVQSDWGYNSIGRNGNGTPMQRGLGTNVVMTQQIRNQFLDITYRNEVSKLNYYDPIAATGLELETIIGELQSEYRSQSVFQDLWNSLQELSMNPESITTRQNLISTAVSFIEKANTFYDRTFKQQQILNQEVQDTVKEINSLTSKIADLNKQISASQASGERPNDLRDERNRCLDALSGLIEIDYKEYPDGRVDILTEGKELLVANSPRTLGLRYTTPGYSFVEPVFTNSPTPLSCNTPPTQFTPLFNFASINETGSNPPTQFPVSAAAGNDSGRLKGILIARGTRPANYLGENALQDPRPLSTPPTDQQLADLYNYKNDYFSANNSLIPKTMEKFDKLVNHVVTMMNDIFAPALGGAKDPNAPLDLNGNKGYTELFTRTQGSYVDKFDSLGNLIPPTNGDYYSQYTIGNIQVNPKLLASDGYNYLCLSSTGDREDPSIVNKILDKWSDKSLNMGDGIMRNVMDSYTSFVDFVGMETNQAVGNVDNQMTLVNQADNKRMSVSAVSTDEEMKNMMLYQHSYNAAARIFNTIDSMINTIIGLV